MRSLISVLFILIHQAVNCQLSVRELNDNNWRIVPGFSNKNSYLMPTTMGTTGARTTFNGPFSAGRVEISPTEQLVAIHVRDKEFGVIRLSEELKISWASSISGRPTRIGIVGDRVIVVHAGEAGNPKTRGNLEITVLNAANGKKIINKIVFKADDEMVAEPKVFFPAGSKEFFVGLRYTNVTNKVKVLPFGIGAGKTVSNFMTSSKFVLLAYDGNLNEISKTELPFKNEASFIQAEMNDKKEIFLVFEDDENSISLQHISSSHKDILATKRITLDLRKNASPELDFYLSKKEPATCFLTFRYKNSEKEKALSIYSVNFSTNETKSYTEIMNREYREKLKAKYNPAYEDAGRLNTNEWTEMEFTHFIEHEDKLIFLKEALVNRYSGTPGDSWGRTTTENGDGILSVFTRDLKLIDETPFAKSTRIYGNDEAATSMHAHQNTVTIVTPLIRGLSASAVIFEYNLDKKQMLRRYIPEKGDIKRSHSLVAGATLWFEHVFVIPVQTDRGYYEAHQRLLKLSY
jgi:hypothetical protein